MNFFKSLGTPSLFPSRYHHQQPKLLQSRSCLDKRRKYEGYIYQILVVLLTSGLLNAEYRNPTRSQHFMLKPQNQTLNEGESTMLQCQVGSLQGVVQWTRNGFAMGYSNFEVKQTCQRCELDISKKDGLYNLIVQNVRLGEDEYYECQVSPGKASVNSLPLRAPVHLTIQVPPKSVTLRQPTPVMAGNLIELACTAEDSNPKTEIVWYRDNQPIREAEVSEKVLSGSRNGTFVTVSKITLPERASPEDDGANIKCKAEHPSLLPAEIYPHLQDSGTLSILYPPSVPQLLGDLSPFRRKGDQVSLTCLSVGGNPLPELTWLRNGLPLRDSGLFTSSSKTLFTSKSSLERNKKVRKFVPEIIKDKSIHEIRSVLEFPIEAEDHQSVYKCRAFAAATMSAPKESALKATFNVTFPPDEVTITGDLSLPVDKTSVYRCEARNANPAPQIQWVVNNDVINVDSNVLSSPTSSSDSFSRSGGSNEALFGDNNLQRSSIRNSKHSSTLSSSVQVTTQIHPPPSLSMSLTYGSGAGIQSMETGYRVTSDLRIKAEPEEDILSLTCIAKSHGHNQEVMTTKTNIQVMVLKPPSAPVISGLPENQALREGQTVHLTCSSLDGSPKPKLTWFKVNQDGSEETEIISKEMENAQKEYQKTKLIKSDNSDEESRAIHNKSNQGAKEHSIATIEIVASREDNTRLYRCDSSNEANKKDPTSSQVRLNVFFPPKSLEIIVERPESRVKEGQYDRTTEYLGDKLKQLTQIPRHVNGFVDAPKRKSPASRNERIKLVIAGELVRLKCVAGVSKPRPLFRWTSGDTFEDQSHLKANRTEKYFKQKGTIHMKSNDKNDFQENYLQGEQIASIVEFVAQPKHNGRIFRCYAQNPTTNVHKDIEDAQEELNTTVTIVVLFKPQFTNKSLTGSGGNRGVFTMIEGESKNITLEAFGNPPQIHYAWSYPSSVTQEACKDEKKHNIIKGRNGPCRIKASSSVLRIRDAKRTDSGDFSVQASNAHGDFNTLATIHLNVLYPPIIKSLSEVVTIDEGKSAVFNCTVDANPNEDDIVSWDLPDRDTIKSSSKQILDYHLDVITKRGQDVFPSSATSEKSKKKVPNWKKRLISEKIDKETTRLTIVKVKREDAGRVICKATNGVGGDTTKSTATTYLKVNHSPWIERSEEQRRNELLSKDRTRKKSDRPQPYVKVAAQIGHQLSIECQATGVPDVSIGWQKHFRPSKEEPIFVDDFKNNDDQEDEIRYFDLDESLFDDTKKIRETDSVKIKKRKYNLKNNKRNKEKKDYPISAYNQVYEIDSSKGESVDRTERCGDYEKHQMRRNTFCSELILANVRTEHYSTLFRCNATNSYGKDEIFYKIVRPGSPETPKELTAENITDTSIQLVWREGFNGGSSQKYFVQVKETKTGHEKYKLKKTKEISETFTVINGLQPNMEYTFRVKARNRHGTSDFSSEITEKTRPMASLESKSNASVGEVVVLAIGICMVVVIAVTIVIYVTCFKNGPRIGLTGDPVRTIGGSTSGAGKDNKKKQKLKFGGSDFKKRDRSNSDGGFSSQGGIQRYTTSKYTNAIHAGLCTLTPTYDRPPRSTSSSSQPDYRELARSFSVPGRDYLDDHDEEDGPENRGLMAMEGSNYNRNMMRNGNTNYKDSMMEPCSLHGTLRKGMWGHNNPNDVTLEDDVFDEKPSPLPGLIAATVACKGGNNNQPGGGSRAIFINPPDPSHHPRYAYFSKGDPLDSSSSSRSRSVIIPNVPDPSSGPLPPGQSRFSTSTRMSSSKFSGLNDSGLGSTCTTVAFAEKERRMRFPSSSAGGCTLVATGGLEDCSKNFPSQNPFSSSSALKSGKNRSYGDPMQNSGKYSVNEARKRAKSTGSFLSRHRSSGSIDGIIMDGSFPSCLDDHSANDGMQHPFVNHNCDQDLSIDTPTPPPPPPPHSISNILLDGGNACTLPRKLDARRTNLSQYTFGKVKRTDITSNPAFINNKGHYPRQFLSSNGRLPNAFNSGNTFRPTTDSSGSSSGVIGGGVGTGVNAKKLFHGIMKIKDGSNKAYNQGLHFPLRRAGSPPDTLPPPPPPPAAAAAGGFGPPSYSLQHPHPPQQQLTDGSSSFKNTLNGETAENHFLNPNSRIDSKPSLLV